MWRGVAGALALLAVAAPGAAAEPRALLDAPRATAVAVAGDTVIAGRDLRRGAVAIDAVPAAGGPPRRLLTVRRPRRGWEGNVQLSASAQRVVALVAFDDEEGGFGGHRVYAGPPAGPLAVVATSGRGPRSWFPVGVDVDADRVLVVEGRAPAFRWRLRVLTPGAPDEPVPGPANRPPPAALAGDRVAYYEMLPRRRHVVRVADRHTGAVEAEIVLRRGEDLYTESIDLAPDGRVIAATNERLVTTAPGSPPAAIPGGTGLGLPRFAGAHVAALQDLPTRFQDRARPVLLDPATGTLRPLGLPSADVDAFAAGPAGAAWIANGCVLSAPFDGPLPSEPPAGPCSRVELALDETDQRLRGRRVRFRAGCIAAPAAGCRGTAVLRTFGGRLLGRGRFAAAPGADDVFTVRLSRSGATRVRDRVRREFGVLLQLATRVEGARDPDPVGVVIARR